MSKHLVLALVLTSIAIASLTASISAILFVWLGSILLISLGVHFFYKNATKKYYFPSLLFSSLYGICVLITLFVQFSAASDSCDAPSNICANENIAGGLLFFLTIIVTIMSTLITGVINLILYLKSRTGLRTFNSK